MPFTGNEDHSISLKDAAKMTENYRTAVESGGLLGGYFGRDALQAILDQQGCTGIRIYNARNDAGEENFVLVGVNSEGEDMTDGPLAEYTLGCPPFCPTASQLTGTA
jgi:hypothetical protein